ncbi:MAG TPA: hypothetical protein VMU83_19155 [Hanamia sp.]|nr:hypothetical protein [Hanamia sp.]
MSEILIYKTEDNQTEVEVKFEQDTVWLSQSQITELFQRDRTVITKHINNIFKEGELDEFAMCKKCTLQIQTDQSCFTILMLSFQLVTE